MSRSRGRIRSLRWIAGSRVCAEAPAEAVGETCVRPKRMGGPKRGLGALDRRRWGALFVLLLFGVRASPGVQERSGRKARTVGAGHLAPVVAVAFRADSPWLATGSMDKTAKLWEVATGRELRTLRSHAGWVTSVAFSPDGRWLVTGSRDNTAKFWDATTGEEIKTLRHRDWVSTVAFSPDGGLLASACGGKSSELVGESADKSIWLWDSRSGEQVRRLIGHEKGVLSVAFSPDGQLLASAGEDGTVRMWDVATGRELQTIRGHGSAVRSVTFSPDGRWLASAGNDPIVQVWDVAKRSELRILTIAGGSFAVAFNPDGKEIVAVGPRPQLVMWEVSTGHIVLEVSGGEDKFPFSAIAFSGRGRWMALGSGDHTAKLWDLKTNRIVRSFGHPAPYWD
jgi:WD40 repeat protein